MVQSRQCIKSNCKRRVDISLSSRYKPIIITSFLAIAIIGVIIYLVGKVVSTETEETGEKGLDEVERVVDLLKNSSFEKEFQKSDWQLFFNPEEYNTTFDRFVVKEGNFSLYVENTGSDSSTGFIEQKVSRLEEDKKYILFGFVRTENCDSARIEISAYDEKDSLLFTGYSSSLFNSNDWTLLNTWIRTQDERIKNLSVRAMIAGKGRFWFDGFKLYSVPIDYPFTQIDFQSPFKVK